MTEPPEPCGNHDSHARTSSKPEVPLLADRTSDRCQPSLFCANQESSSQLPDARLRHAALALDTGTQGLLYIVGPLLVAALASAYNPTVALTVTAVLGLAGITMVVLAPPSRRWRRTPAACTVPLAG
ncbi:hypothetical protein OK006_7828 [Actinobacteria bacterium OK006]|nr:hypothetical protein OK006_7828 [Actinobacteria bacterium OK006]